MTINKSQGQTFKVAGINLGDTGAGICARAALRRMLKSHGQPQESLCACTRRSDEERGVQT
eukprot:319409-Hanusia_phi.AAC.1